MSTGTTERILDGVVNGAATFTKTLGNGVNWFDQKVIDGAVNGLANLAGFTGGLLRYIQSGNVQRYAVVPVRGRRGAGRHLHQDLIEARKRESG